jgi:hypothetical protein
MNFVLLLISVLIVLTLLLSASSARYKKLARIRADLSKLKKRARLSQMYAIEENLVFFKAIRTLPGYLYWALTRRRHIETTKLLEIADLPLPHWEQELYQDLTYVENKKFPGLSKPLMKLLLKFIHEKPDAIILELGCGSMEVVRQTFDELHKHDAEVPNVMFVGVDLAPQAWDAIRQNFTTVADKVDVARIDSLNQVKTLKVKKPTILFLEDDALKIAKQYGKHFDLIYSSRFKHHLNQSEKAELDTIAKTGASMFIEYDDYRSAISWLPPLLTAWYRPILLNGAIFSQLRQPSIRQLKSEQRNGKSGSVLLFSPPGSYAKITERVIKR